MEIKKFSSFILENESSDRPESFEFVKRVSKGDFLILKDKKTNKLWAFYYSDFDKKDFGEYADVEKIYYGTDEDGDPDWEYDWENYDPDDEDMVQFVNNNIKNLQIGKGLRDWEDGIELVEINQALAHDFLSNFYELSPKILGLT
jgi:hypothetical protein